MSDALTWRKSSFSSASCVEVAGIPDGVAVRNSREPNEAVIRYTADEWVAFLAGVRAGEFDDLG